LDYDFDDYEDDDTESKMYGNRTMEDSNGSVSGRGIQWVIIGDPMANRHVYAERLSKLLQVPHISMGTLVRQELHPRSSLYMQIASSINQGKLVPEEVIFGLLSKRLEEGYCRGETGFILDGIPRTKIQAEILEQIVDIDLVLNLKCPECLLTKHIANHTCSTCEGLVNIGSSKLSLNLNSKDNQMGLSAASDAKNNALKESHRISAEQRKPLEEYYRKQKKLLEFQVADGPGETWQGLLAALQLQHMSGAVTSSQKLSA
jgi:adenylate kinase